MKSPNELATKLAQQWQQATYRVSRLLSSDKWPVVLSIGQPTKNQLAQASDSVKEHIAAWQQVQLGTVLWETKTYRDLSEPVRLPVKWQLNKPSDWVRACNNIEVANEFHVLDHILAQTAAEFRELLIRKRALWRGKDIGDIKNCIKIASELEPGSAQGKPLRLMSGLDVDTKFFERNENLLLNLLDKRFDGEVKEQGLAVFLDAKSEDDHWLLVVPMKQGLIPFPRIRISTKQLEQYELPTQTILVVENERCEHLLPKKQDMIAILGAGLDLNWLASPMFDGKQILYWGDIDTWGFKMLAKARELRPNLQPVLMDRATFDDYKDKSAVVEPVKSNDFPLKELSEPEQLFYQQLILFEKGRLEQEYLPKEAVEAAINGRRHK